jgi:hypothetical protein
MPVVGPHGEDEMRPAAADDLDDLQLLIAAGAQVAVAEIELLAKTRAEDAHGLEGLTAAHFRRPARSQLTARQLDDADAQAVLDGFGDGAAA